MITPGDEIPLDDSYDDDAEDQLSQKDIHSNGFDEEDEIDLDDLDVADIDGLNQAYDASESAYTLDDEDDDE
jgi:hypothetical protein